MASSAFWLMVGLVLMVATASVRSALAQESPETLAMQAAAEAIQAVEDSGRRSSSPDVYINALRAVADIARAVIEMAAVAQHTPPVGVPGWLGIQTSQPEPAVPNASQNKLASSSPSSSPSDSSSLSRDLADVVSTFRTGATLLKLLTGQHQ